MTDFLSPDEARLPDVVGRRRNLFIRQTVRSILLLTICLVLARHIGKGEFNYNVDESQHAFTGVFFADLMRDRPIHNPVEYTYLYYAHYPALSGIIHWPPLFYICEGVFFRLFGMSVICARTSIIAFAALGLWFWFRLIESLHSRPAAVAATLALAFCPSVLLFEKAVMLEIPSLTMCIIASYFWIRFLKSGRSSSLIWFALAGSLAALTKQNSVYLLLFCLLSMSVLQRWRLLRRRATLASVAIGLCLAGPYYYLLYKLHWSTIAGDVLEAPTTHQLPLLYYWRAIPQLVGWPLFVLALTGLVASRWWDRRENSLVFLSWIFSVYLTMTLIGHKEARYVIYLVPAVVYFTIWPIVLPKTSLIWVRLLSVTALFAVVAYTTWSAWRFERPYVAGYARVAAGIRQVSSSGTILADVDIPANLVFFVRLIDSERRFIVLRKSLYSFRIKQDLGGQEYIHTREEIEKLLRDDGIRFIVVSNRPPDKFSIETTLREMLETSQFRLIGQYPVEGNTPDWNNYYLSLYENLQAGPPRVPSLRIPMLTMDHDFEVPFQKLGIPTVSPPH
jgi:Dolichyl-phosphate-mannose-protein mannosyltransferase